MIDDPRLGTPQLEHRLALMLQWGTGIASAAIVLGLVIEMWEASAGAAMRGAVTGPDMVTAGIVAFILLPTLRVVVMLAAYIRQRDMLLSAIAATVFGIIVVGFVVGVAVSASAS